jgi:predicted glutamine amidotransferase
MRHDRGQAMSSPPLFLAYIRTATGSSVQQTNRHPFCYGRCLWAEKGREAR